ncbi:MAG: nucleotidyltransferase domain-containing protein [Nanoarchaeota archaeon]
MLNIIDNLELFFEDCYRRINVREYARLMKISPPTASKILSELNSQGLLSMEKDRNYIFYYANRIDKTFIDLSRIYWKIKLNSFINYFDKHFTNYSMILFGSLSKAEAKKDSDIDVCIIGHSKEVDIRNFEIKLNRKIQLFFFSSLESIKNKELANNIINGYILQGKLKL